MTELSPCSECARHVAIDVAAPCPFCGSTAPRAAARARRVVGPLTRAAIFTGATVLAACGGSTADGADSTDTTGDDVIVDDSTSGGDGTGEGAGAGDDVEDEREATPDDSCCPPYGTPPARDAIV